MAMVKCPECGTKISEYAAMCPRCGIDEAGMEQARSAKLAKGCVEGGCAILQLMFLLGCGAFLWLLWAAGVIP